MVFGESEGCRRLVASASVCLNLLSNPRRKPNFAPATELAVVDPSSGRMRALVRRAAVAGLVAPPGRQTARSSSPIRESQPESSLSSSATRCTTRPGAARARGSPSGWRSNSCGQTTRLAMPVSSSSMTNITPLAEPGFWRISPRPATVTDDPFQARARSAQDLWPSCPKSARRKASGWARSDRAVAR